MKKFWLFVLFLIPSLFMFFQLQILGHELYHFTEHSPYSTAICINRDLSSNIVAFTVSSASTDYQVLAKNKEMTEAKTFLFYDYEEEFVAEATGYAVAFTGFFGLLTLFALIVRKM